jgi:uncharacterized protein involved in copper resistance
MLTLRQLLTHEHTGFVFTFIQTKVDLLDEANKDNKDKTTGSDVHVYLGSPKDENPKDENPMDGTPMDGTPMDGTPMDGTPMDEPPKKDPTTVATLADQLPRLVGQSGFRKMLEEFLNSFYEENQLPRDAYLRVQSNEMVISSITVENGLLTSFQ